MRVIFLRSNPVDPDSRVEKEVNSLVKAGYSVEILAWDRNEKYKVEESFLELENGKVRIFRFGIPASFGGGIKGNLKPLIIFQMYLIKWLVMNNESYDVIHACDFDTAYTASIVVKLFKKKFVYDIFDYYVDSFGVPKRIKGFIEKKDIKVINAADRVIICTEKRVEQLRGSNPNSINIIHNTPAKVINYKLNETNPIFVHGSGRIKIVYVGILGKGRLISEVAHAISKRDDCEYHIAGFGPLEQTLKTMSNKIDNVYYHGKISYKETLELENQCDIMTALYDPQIPNHKYAAPNKFYEALMLGKPLIVAKNTGIDDIVLSEDIGEVIDFNEVSFDNALTNLINRKHEWPSIARKSTRLYYEHYSWDEMEIRLLNLYKGI